MVITCAMLNGILILQHRAGFKGDDKHPLSSENVISSSGFLEVRCATQPPDTRSIGVRILGFPLGPASGSAWTIAAEH